MRGVQQVKFALGQCVFDGFAIRGFIDNSAKALRHSASVSPNMFKVQPLEPDLRSPFHQDEGSYDRTHRIESIHLTQNSNCTSRRRFSISVRIRPSSAWFLATKVTLNRRYGPASSQGTVESSFSVISHCETFSAL